MSKKAGVECWTIYTDGSSCAVTKKAAIGVVIYKSVKEEPVAQIHKRIPYVTNHAAEYEAVIVGLREAFQMGARKVEVRSDLQTMVNQLCGISKVNAAHLKVLHEKAKEEIARFDSGFDIVYIQRNQNSLADKLAKEALNSGVPDKSTSQSLAPTVHAAVEPSRKMPASNPERPRQFWKPVGNELCVWNLDRLWTIAKNFPTETVTVSELESFLDAKGWFGDEPLTLRRVAELSYQTSQADLELPLLVCDADLLDGRFRLAKALSTGRKEVPVKRLAHMPRPDSRYPLYYAP